MSSEFFSGPIKIKEPFQYVIIYILVTISRDVLTDVIKIKIIS